jgi:glycosyltransferase involved in cell wall biosynthesis
MKNRRIKRLVHAVNRISYRLSDKILAVTQKVADELHTCDHVPQEKLEVWESGANTTLFKPMNREACCSKLGLPPENLYVGFIGTCFDHQGVGILIECAPQVIRTCSQVKFLIVGDGPMKIVWQSQVEAKHLQPWFIFTGHIDYRQVPVHCNAMDVCVAPFLRTAGESSGVKVFEYLSCGKPVVLSDIQGTGEQFLPSNAVILTPAENIDHLAHTVCTLLLDSEKRRTMGQNGRAYIRHHHDRFELSGKIENLAEALIGSRRPRKGLHG